MTDIPLKPQNERFTDRQWQAIFDKGDNLLVSASAGSGKTTVLVRRVIEKLKSGSNIDELLIVTFTEAAAREMKERIQEALQEAINQDPDPDRRSRFTKQLVLLPMANISTLHAFCMTVIRRFYFLIDLDPVFRMLTDETEILLLKEEIWDELREEKYAEKEEIFFQLTENFSGDRSDEGLTDLIMSLYTFARANPDPKAWLADLNKNYEVPNGLENTPLYQTQIRPLLMESVEMALEHYQQAYRLAEFDPAFEKIYHLIEREYAQIKRFYEALENNDLNAAYAQVEGFDLKQRFPGLRKAEYKALSDEINELRKSGRSYVENAVNDTLPFSPARMTELMGKSLPLVEEMAELTREFLERYQLRKQERKVLDFNDLEHFALQILQGDGTGSEASRYYRRKFEEVLVDEYQDVNRLQETLLSWVRSEKTPGNMFMVGDVKQSIYAFRLADPTLFIEKYLNFEKEEGGRRIVLAENFRSRKEVLSFTNLIFQQLMDERVGQIPYDEAAALIPGFPNFPDSDQFQTELLIYEKEVADDPDVVETKTEGELNIVALKIRELIDQGFKIYDKKAGVDRPVEYRDIVLLTPTKKNNLDILDVFKKFNIPLEVNDAQNYFQATEIRTMISLMQIIDNPYNDIPLAAVLRSPIVGLHEDELAEIRLADKNADFYQALLTFADTAEESDLLEKVLRFLDQLERWRDHSKKQAIPDLLWEIYEESAYLDYILGLPAGQQRYANLIALVDRAQSYERSSFRGLYQFIRFIEKMQEKDKDLAEPLAIPAENAVRVMTIHASKGLEFPVVFLLDMSKNFNNQDFTNNYIFEEQLGAGIQYVDPERRVRYETMPYQAIKQLRLKKAFSEEMRKLYVALTRAEQKLFLVGSYKDRKDAFKKWSEALSQKELVLNPVLRMKKTQILMNWVGMSLVRHPDMEKFFPEAVGKSFTVHSDTHFKIQWWNQEQIMSAVNELETKPEERLITVAAIDEAEFSALHKRLDYRYPYEKAPKTTSYQSVSEIKRIFDDPDNLDDTRLAWQSSQEQATFRQYRYAEERLARPRFIEQTSSDAASVGTATHTVMQMLPLDRKPTEASIDGFIQELIDASVLDVPVAKKIDRKSLLWFFETQLGEQLLEQTEKVKREQPFAMLKNAQQIFMDYDDTEDDLLIHGIIDGFINYEDHLVLYDLKTDHVIGGNIEPLKEKYRGQLKLYQEALEEAYQKPVTEVYLVLLSGRQLVKMA